MLDNILKKHTISISNLLWEVEIKPVSVFRDNVVEYGYVDNGRADIVTVKIEDPFEYKTHKIVGYTIIDKYLYGRENNTSKKYTLTLYHD